jgi:hypothetical protein
MQSQATEVVSHRARPVGVGVSILKLRDVIAKLPMSKAGGGEGKETERMHERVHAAVAEAQTGGPVVVNATG